MSNGNTLGVLGFRKIVYNKIMNYNTLYEKTKDLSLLLVEDYEPLREDMAEVLEDLFKTVVVASNGIEALKCYREYTQENKIAFDIVVSDIVMPYMNGVDLCEIIRQENAAQQIIILSAYTDSEYLLRLINLGIAQFINKPIQHEELLEVLYTVSEKIDRKEEALPQSTLVDLGDDVIWDKERLIMLRDRLPISLTKHEIILMQLFVEKSEQVCTSDDMMHCFYLQGIDLDEKNIRNLVFKLRKKLPKKAIESIYGLGYKLIPVT